jgi:hypothetical protein
MLPEFAAALGARDPGDVIILDGPLYEFEFEYELVERSLKRVLGVDELEAGKLEKELCLPPDEKGESRSQSWARSVSSSASSSSSGMCCRVGW